MPEFNDLASLDGPLGLSPREKTNWREGVFEAVREIECDWADRVAVYNSLINTEYPYIAGTEAYAFAGDFVGWGESSDVGSGGMISYEKARLRVYYDNAIEYVDGLWLSERLLPSGEFRQLDARSFQWDSGGSPGTMLRDEEAPAMRQVFLDYYITYYRVPSLPAAILTHIGCCNNAAVESYTLGLTFQPETLILASAPARRTLSTATTRAWELSYHFRFTPFGANKFWRPETNQWEFIYWMGSSTRYIQHALADFSQLVPTMT